jgi:RNA-binding motif protein, X-linked 2
MLTVDAPNLFAQQVLQNSASLIIPQTFSPQLPTIFTPLSQPDFWTSSAVGALDILPYPIMNSIRQTQALNKRELEVAVPPSASWHADYRDTAYIYIGGFSFDLSEGDLLTIFSQYGNPTHLNLIRDRETGKSKGFAFLKYEDQRSCDLAVDNLGGAEVLGRMLRVDHTRYKKKEGEDEETFRVDRLEGGDGDEVNGNGKRSSGGEGTDGDERSQKRRKQVMIKEERELEDLLRIKEGEEEDPMRQYLIEEKKEEVQKALARIDKKGRHRHKHRADMDRDCEDGRGHGSRKHRDDMDEGRHHKHRHSKRDGQDHRARRTDKDNNDRHSHQRQRRHISDDELSRSRSRSRSRKRRGAESPDSRSGTGRALEYLSSRRRDPKYDRMSYRSRSRSLSRERRRNRE